ncbi:MAG: hypothetical protein P8Y68_14160 [Anaerolineales bacterium]
MKHAVSVSLGSAKRDKRVEIELFGERVLIERIGTDGDMEAAAKLYQEMDGKVDAFGVGGTDLGVLLDGKFYPLYSIHPMIRYVKKTPLVDGSGLKNTLEGRALPALMAHLDGRLGDKRAFIVSGAERWGLSKSFLDSGFDCVFGDLMFGLSLPLPVRSEMGLKRLADLVMPIAGRLPFSWIYPTGEKQDLRTPKYVQYYQWASVIAGDCHYIKKHLPDDLEGKAIITNTTTPEDIELFRQVGISTLVTTTPSLDGRSFGTNMMEAALVAVSGEGRPLTLAELDQMIAELDFQPEIQDLN